MSMLSRLTAALATTVVLTAGVVGPARAADTKLDVVASFSVLGDLATRVGGERVAVTTLVGPGGDAHVYEPTPADAARVAEADVLVTNGLEFEGFIDRLIEASGTKAPIITAASGIKPLKAGGHDDPSDKAHSGEAKGHDDHAKEAKADGHDDHAKEAKAEHGAGHGAGGGHEAGHEGGHAHDHGEFDPHAWHAIPNARSYVATIADGFCAADPDGCETYRANAKTYTGELDALEAEVKATLGAIPEDRRTIIVSHGAFGYLANAYDLKFLAPLGLSTESEASAADVARLIDQVRDQGASGLFVENVADPRLIERIAAETGLAVGGTLYSDALSPAGGPASTYVDMMRHNATTIASAITGS